MRIPRHPSRLTLAESEAQTGLVDLLLAHLERAYVTAGEPGVLSAARDLLGRMDPIELRALAYSLDLIPEPPSDGDEAAARREPVNGEG